MTEPKRAMRIDPADNVAVMLENVHIGELIAIDGEDELITAAMDINLPHKIACTDIPKGAPIIKYGCKIGEAAVDIKRGEHVHVHNISFKEEIEHIDRKRW